MVALRLDFETVQIDKGKAVGIFGPGNTDNDSLLCGNQFRVARRGLPFARDVGAKPLAVEKFAESWHRVLEKAIPVFTEVIPFEDLFEPADPLCLHRSGQLYRNCVIREQVHPESKECDIFLIASGTGADYTSAQPQLTKTRGIV